MKKIKSIKLLKIFEEVKIISIIKGKELERFGNGKVVDKEY